MAWRVRSECSAVMMNSGLNHSTGPLVREVLTDAILSQAECVQRGQRPQSTHQLMQTLLLVAPPLQKAAVIQAQLWGRDTKTKQFHCTELWTYWSRWILLKEPRFACCVCLTKRKEPVMPPESLLKATESSFMCLKSFSYLSSTSITILHIVYCRSFFCISFSLS